VTCDHKHRTWRVKRGGIVEKVLRGPTLAVTQDRARAERSRWMWAVIGHGTYGLTPLGVLHTLTGLVLDTYDPEEESKR